MNDQTTQIIVAALMSGFAGWALPALGRRIASWRSGFEKRKRRDLDRMATEKLAAEQREAAALVAQEHAEDAREEAENARLKAERDRDKEASLRRRCEESLSIHRRIILEAECISPDSMPPWPY